MKHVQAFLSIEAVAFAVAALVHGGFLADGYQHREATIAEGVIAGVLTIGLILGSLRPSSSRGAGLAAQAVALLGTLVGIAMIAIGVGPQSPLDLAFHACLVGTLLAGLVTVSHRPHDGSAGLRRLF